MFRHRTDSARCHGEWRLDPYDNVRSLKGGESGCSEWLQFVSQGSGPMAPPIEVRLCTIVFFRSGEMMYIWTVYTWRESVGVLQVTGSLLHVVLACHLAELRDYSSCDCIQVPGFYTDLLLRLRRVVGGVCRTVPQWRLGTVSPGLTGKESTSGFTSRSRGTLRRQS